MNFKEYYQPLNEAKFRNLSPKLVSKIKKIADVYSSQYRVLKDSDLPKLHKEGRIEDIKEETEAWKIYFKTLGIKMPRYFKNSIGNVTVFDFENKENIKIQFVVIYGNVVTDFASYSEQFHAVNLFNNNLKNLTAERIESLILHELTHAFQEYKLTSDEYDTEAGKPSGQFRQDVYYKEPIELDTHLNEIAYTLNQKYKTLKDGIKRAKDPATQKILSNRLNLFLQELKVLIKAPPESYFKFKELNLPFYLQDFDNFLKTIKDDKELWKKFKLKLVNFYNSLEEARS
jgi:hypothetical protein